MYSFEKLRGNDQGGGQSPYRGNFTFEEQRFFLIAAGGFLYHPEFYPFLHAVYK
jgi:hypothetical protein